MNGHDEKNGDEKSRAVAHTPAAGKGISHFDDNRPEAIAQRKLQAIRNLPQEAPVQRARDQDDDEALDAYATYLLNEMGRVMNIDKQTVLDGGVVARTNTLYLLECRTSIYSARAMGAYLQAAVDETLRALNNPAHNGEVTTRDYAIGSLRGDHDQLSAADIVKIEDRIAAMNAGQSRFNLHIGVGGVPTMDLTNMSFGGGGGRGNVRLQFLGGAMAIVRHDGSSWI